MKRKRFVTASLGVMLLLVATVPLAAQTTSGGGHIFRTPIQIVSQPDDGFASQPSGYFPAQMRAAYRFNAIPNQGQGVTVGIADACDDPNIEADLGVFSAQFNLPSCTTANGCFTSDLAGQSLQRAHGKLGAGAVAGCAVGARHGSPRPHRPGAIHAA